MFWVATQAQSNGFNPNNGVKKDTSMAKSNTNSWKSYTSNTTYKKINSEQVNSPDTSLHLYHRRPFSQPYNMDCGNLGSPTQSLLFVPLSSSNGPSLGYHVYDAYRFLPDSINYYNTIRPYSVFTYNLGSKLEQLAEIIHTQNVKPNWNFAFDYRKINSDGFYKIQRTNHDNVCLSTHYKSLNQHYELYGAIIYNKQQQDENGGIDSAGQLDDPNYYDRRTIDTKFQNPYYSIVRSSVTNMQRDATIFLQHAYSWGRTDTTYNADSTQYAFHLVPKFSITHTLQYSSERHEFKDVVPDSLRYTGLFEHGFANGNIYTSGQDSVFSQQNWNWIDNKIMLNGFIGKAAQPSSFSAGMGTRYDEFRTAWGTGTVQNNIFSNYLSAQIKKEALQAGAWLYHADAQLFMNGEYAGNFKINGTIGKTLKGNLGALLVGFQQSLNNAPYSYTLFQTQYDTITKSFNKESITSAYAEMNSPKYRFSIGAKTFVIANYIYLNDIHRPDQYSPAFNISEVYLRKNFKMGSIYLDNEMAYQQVSGDAPVNIPAFMGKHQLSFEKALFKGALKFATGIEVRYQTSYYASGYDPFFNRFYYQHSVYSTNPFQSSAFFNFRIKRFKAYIMGDQLQQLIYRNNMNYPNYPAQNAMIRFGFSWIMVN